ncbi:MAG: hypothetical protein KC421_03755 [Anaerolineales bacterium]|nr:hypothetical protein [Anaerolineales bacterium]
MDTNNSIERHAIRILFILYYCRSGTDSHKQLGLFGDKDSYLDSETKLQKFDFWIRYPDYLAAALLHQCSQGKYEENDIAKVKDIVRQIFHDQEPVLRNIPMRRYLRGAHEPLDNVTSFLSSRNLAYKRIIGKGNRTHYYITQKGMMAVTNILQECPEAVWYKERCNVLHHFFGHLSGRAIKNIQYLEKEYENTPLKQNIPSITKVVKKRFEVIFKEPVQ